MHLHHLPARAVSLIMHHQQFMQSQKLVVVREKVPPVEGVLQAFSHEDQTTFSVFDLFFVVILIHSDMLGNFSGEFLFLLDQFGWVSPVPHAHEGGFDKWEARLRDNE